MDCDVSGLQHAFIYAVYSPSIGFTEAFGSKSKQLVALSGIFIAFGEVFGEFTFSCFSQTHIRTKRIFCILKSNTSIVP